MCKTNTNTLREGCSVGLESNDSFQVQDTVVSGIALRNLTGLGDEIGKLLGFFSHGNSSWASCIVRRRSLNSVIKNAYHCRTYQTNCGCDFPLLSVPVGTWGCSKPKTVGGQIPEYLWTMFPSLLPLNFLTSTFTKLILKSSILGWLLKVSLSLRHLVWAQRDKWAWKWSYWVIAEDLSSVSRRGYLWMFRDLASMYCLGSLKAL